MLDNTRNEQIHYRDFMSDSQSQALDNAGIGRDDEGTDALYLNYTNGLLNGSRWGDHLTLIAIADMLGITISVFRDDTVEPEVIKPGSGSSIADISIGFSSRAEHYVALHKKPQTDLNQQTEVQYNENKNTIPSIKKHFYSL